MGEDVRNARLRAGMTLRELGAVSGVSAPQLSRVERGHAPHSSYETLALIGAAVGLDVSIRAFPNGTPIRDAAQVALLARLRSILPPAVRLRFEVPLGIPGDLRAWDAAMEARTWWRPVEAESRLGDVQALQRRIRLKCRDGGVAELILLVADTRHNRHVLRASADSFAELFPVRPRTVRQALVEGQAPVGSGVLLL